MQGRSAGDIFFASIGMFWHEDKELIKPAGMILCYPVITSGEFAHRGSFEALLKSRYTPEMLKRNSLELQVTENTPKAFIWHTYTDDCVPVENSLLLIQSMKNMTFLWNSICIHRADMAFRHVMSCQCVQMDMEYKKRQQTGLVW